MTDNKDLLRKLPSVDQLLKTGELSNFTRQTGRKPVINCIREAIDNMRTKIVKEENPPQDSETITEQITRDTIRRIHSLQKPFYRRVVNATGIILHTGLGRAVLSQPAVKHIQDQLSSYSLLQLSSESGKRSRRDSFIEQLLAELTGAEAATVVNNNAAATSIVLNTFAENKEVIISRGQLVEIGGSFRLPDVMSFSRAKMVEVGTTNKTHPDDYARAITENTAAIMRVHPSNYKIQGFSSEVELEPLVELAHRNGLVMIDDIGAGSLIDFSQFGFEYEPTLPDSIKQGADIVTSSGDKLMGASQAGIILGKGKLIEKIRKNQFARIVRVDKLTLACLEATLKLFFDEQTAVKKVPTLEMVMRKPQQLKNRANQLAEKINGISDEITVSVQQGCSQMGSGSFPTQNLETYLTAIQPDDGDAAELAGKLRSHSIPVFTRIQKGNILIDPRTLQPGDTGIIEEAFRDIFKSE